MPQLINKIDVKVHDGIAVLQVSQSLLPQSVFSGITTKSI